MTIISLWQGLLNVNKVKYELVVVPWGQFDYSVTNTETVCLSSFLSFSSDCISLPENYTVHLYRWWVAWWRTHDLIISKMLAGHGPGVLTCSPSQTRTKCPKFPRFSHTSELAGFLLAEWKPICPTAPECSRSPPSQIWLNVTCRLGAERGFLAELRREQEPSGSVCLSVCLCAAAVSVCLGHSSPPLFGFRALDTASAAMDPSLSASRFQLWGTLLRWMLQCP